MPDTPEPPAPTPSATTDQPCLNTDRELWRERPGDFYADSIHVTQSGGIGINCGGTVIVMPVRAWHRLALPPASALAATAELIAPKPCVCGHQHEWGIVNGEPTVLPACRAESDSGLRCSCRKYAPAATAGTEAIESDGEPFTDEQAAALGRRLAERRSGLPITEVDNVEMESPTAAPTGEEAEWLQRFMAQGLRDAENYHDVDGSLTGHPDAWRRAMQAVTAQATALAALRKAREAWHYYVCASDQELRDAGLTRADALRVAYEADDVARAALAPQETNHG